ncbi:DnaJ domain-containing protein [Eubacterium sp. MSJ-13]|uniref:DnaJ domain-containing protein n=1 Tax=Eubacterium sp. MSJ-13 TaxID=2841513 RepID=UPI001C120824|nr:DnaJ domain-containing protein [Eubacterium sp. MSJ-13]MBU5477818.1 DnaJ domain-containing protein [Eubacterium sp. MSJ-13]
MPLLAMRGCIKISPLNFKDYYQILQVHYDASPDVIKAAYRKLCTLYHPDVSHNPNEDRRMFDINEAYSTLSDPAKRTAYHKKWLDNRTMRSKNVYPAASFNSSLTNLSAKDVLDKFFHALLTKNWTNAYSCLTLEDQEKFSLEEFSAWKDAVNSCFEMQDYRISFYKNYYKCRLEGVIYPQVTEFAVIINDTDLQLSQTSQNISHKYVAYDGNSWKVCLGMHSLKQATLKFKLMAARRQNYDPVSIYNKAVSRNDPLTGLLSEKGFYDDAFKEIERHKRYNNPVTFAVFQIDCEKTEREIYCLCQCASIIKTESRINDIIARLGNKQIICLFAETNEIQAAAAVNKFMHAIKQRQSEPFTVNAGIMQYNKVHSLEDTVFSISSNVSNRKNTVKINNTHI